MRDYTNNTQTEHQNTRIDYMGEYKPNGSISLKLYLGYVCSSVHLTETLE